MHKADALGGQQAHSNGSLRVSLLWQTPSAWVPKGGLPMSDSAVHLPGPRGCWEREHHVHQMNHC